MFNRFNLLSIVCLSTLIGCSQPSEPTITLARAVQIGDIDQLERNIHWNADINKPGPEGMTPLHVAATKGSLVMTKILVKNGADFEITDPQGHTPLLKALIARNTIVAEYLFKNGAKLDPNTALHETAKLGSADRDVIGFLLRRGATLDNTDADGNTPLHSAILNDQRVVAKYLINRGASLDIRNRAGMSPLALAIERKNQDIERILRQFGASEAR
ncbi:MAG: ankyrin repeat domain-containing protein [Candidatus Thiodiazotropha endolucinida]|nr:ankyrin repeat domain-containing protein [Candidatus Thiodiazotropha taylori]MCW4349734.1 ankyrin repeat domain-containing protein [Candidatus Thiodiazotropha endolucinida]